MEKKVKILGVSGSPRGDESRSERMLKEVLKHAESYGAETEIIRICEKNILPCEGCYSKTKRGEKCVFPCVHDGKDDTMEVMYKIINADALVISSPVYWGAPKATIMEIIAKMTCIGNNVDEVIKRTSRENPLEGKIVGFAMSYDMDGVAKAFGDLAWPLSNMGLIILPYTVFMPANIDDSGELIQKALELAGRNKFIWVKNIMRLAGRNLVLLTRHLEGFNLDDGKVKLGRY